MFTERSPIRCLLLALLPCQVVTTMAGGQSLEQIHQDVRGISPPPRLAAPQQEAPKRERQKKKRRYTASITYASEEDCDEDDDDGLGEFVAGVLLVGFTSPFWMPRVMIEDDDLDPANFARYPYLHDMDGYMATRRGEAADDYPWLMRLRAEYLTDLDSLSRAGGQVLFDTRWRFGIDSEFNYHRENAAAGLRDRLWTGDVNVLFRFAQSRNLQMRTGVGLNWLADELGTGTGFNFTYSGDWFPCNPWIFSMEIDLGRLGAATLFHGRVTGGVQFHRFEFYTGYDYFDVGSTQINSLIGGMRLWY